MSAPRKRRLNARQQAWQGSKWIHPTTRLAIYLRDGLRCNYCLKSLIMRLAVSNVRTCLDHIRPVSKGGSNKPSNLVACCEQCNLARGDKPFKDFARHWPHDLRRVRWKLPRKEALIELKHHGTVRKFMEASARAVRRHYSHF